MCGVFGIFNHDDAATITALGLHSLQHRGQEAGGIVTHNKNNFYLKNISFVLKSLYKKKSTPYITKLLFYLLAKKLFEVICAEV